MQLILGGFVFLVDQWLKSLLIDGATINTGIGFGLLDNEPLAVTLLVSIVVIIATFIINQYWSSANKTQQILMSLLAAGILSNLVDRIKVGGVIDYLSIGTWVPAFNLADVAIVGSLLVLVVISTGAERS